MTHDLVLRIGSLVGKNKIRDAARHNLRELSNEPHIDAALSAQNRVLHGAATGDEVARQAKAFMQAAGISKFRKNGIVGLELLVCLPFNFKGDAMAFFADALAWADEFYQLPMVSAVAHFDESAPHMHVILLPIIDGRLQGSVVKGDRKRVHAMQTDFYAKVGRRYGLRRKTAQKLSNAVRRKTAMQVLDAMTANLALLNGGQVRNLLLDAIAQNLEPFCASVGVALPEPKARPGKKTFVGIMIKKQKLKRKKSPIGDCSPKRAIPYALLGDLEYVRVEVPGFSGFGLSLQTASMPC